MKKINKILFITLSNIGDVILTLPALDYLKDNFPGAKITVMVGPRSKEVFEGDAFIARLIVFDKHSKLRDKIKLFFALRQERFGAVIDFRNSFFGALLPARYRTSALLRIPASVCHMQERNMYRLKRALGIQPSLDRRQVRSLLASPQDAASVDGLLRRYGISDNDPFIVVNPATAGGTKRWGTQEFSRLCESLAAGNKVVLVGAKAYQPICAQIQERALGKVYDLCGMTTLKGLAYLLKKSSLLITPDTGTLQIASYLDIPIVALFGATSEKRYGPWSSRFRVVKKQIFCRPCQKAQCRFGTVECMKQIRAQDVLRQVRDILSGGPAIAPGENEFKRILIVRTDRIGDVLLSTPVIAALRDRYPDAYIAMMVSPYAKDIVEHNPYLDKVILYDKDGKHKSWRRSVKFALNLKKKKFDLALVLHPVNRAHIVVFLAGIPRRIGYNRKMGFLLTDKLEHAKHLGRKHELEYSLDLVRYLGIEPKDKNPCMPIQPESEQWVDDLFGELRIRAGDRLLAIHPGASCPSKVWPQERFAEVADALSEKYGFKVFVVAGPKDIAVAQAVSARMRAGAINLAGKTSVSQLASLLKRCRLFISNDSGPVHISQAVGTPVISIFGRSQKGLGPTRWGPLGRKDVSLRAEVGCIECLAHNCVKDFACLKAIRAETVVSAAKSILT